MIHCIKVLKKGFSDRLKLQIFGCRQYIKCYTNKNICEDRSKLMQMLLQQPAVYYIEPP